MGSRLASIHCEPRIGWQGPFSQKMREGLAKIGIAATITDSRIRTEIGFPILLGTTCWRRIEASGPYLLVDRCSFGDTNHWVSLVWNGHGRRGDHRIPREASPARWEGMGVDLQPWRKSGSRIVLCGQTESYSPHWALNDWYRSVRATHFRPHPAGDNPTGLPIAKDFENAIAVTLNSSVAVQCVIDGVPTITMDEGSMAWDVTGHSLNDIRTPDRLPWLHALAWTQWSHDEIREGKPIAHLFEE
jgi:hypothetical protein